VPGGSQPVAAGAKASGQTATSRPKAVKTAPPQWRVRTADGEEYGPIDREELDAWVAEGRIDAECQVLQDGWQRWQWADEVYEQLATEGAGAESEANPFADIGDSGPRVGPPAFDAGPPNGGGPLAGLDEGTPSGPPSLPSGPASPYASSSAAAAEASPSDEKSWLRVDTGMLLSILPLFIGGGTIVLMGILGLSLGSGPSMMKGTDSAPIVATNVVHRVADPPVLQQFGQPGFPSSPSRSMPTRRPTSGLGPMLFLSQLQGAFAIILICLLVVLASYGAVAATWAAGLFAPKRSGAGVYVIGALASWGASYLFLLVTMLAGMSKALFFLIWLSLSCGVASFALMALFVGRLASLANRRGLAQSCIIYAGYVGVVVLFFLICIIVGMSGGNPTLGLPGVVVTLLVTALDAAIYIWLGFIMMQGRGAVRSLMNQAGR